MTWCRFLLVSVLVGLSAACDPVEPDERANRIIETEDSLGIGLVWGDGAEGLFVEGATLAIDEINERGGIRFHEGSAERRRPLRAVIADASGDDPRRIGLEVARSLARDPQLAAVIGHSTAATAVPASITYEFGGVLYINPAVTDPKINKHGFQYVFTTIPNNAQFAQQIATFGFGLGYRRLAVLNSRADGPDQTTKAFIQNAATLGMTIVVRRSFFANRENFRDILADLGAFQFDALFLAADKDLAATIVRQSLEMNLRTPFLMAALIDVLPFRESVGRETPHITLPVLFNPAIARLKIRSFRHRFSERYGEEPDGWAAQGYDAVHMLEEAMQAANSPVPLSIATVLRYTLSWPGITGRHSFDRDGSIYTKVLEFATLEEGQIEFHSADGGVEPYEEPEETEDTPAGS